MTTWADGSGNFTLKDKHGHIVFSVQWDDEATENARYAHAQAGALGQLFGFEIAPPIAER